MSSVIPVILVISGSIDSSGSLKDSYSSTIPSNSPLLVSIAVTFPANSIILQVSLLSPVVSRSKKHTLTALSL